MRILFSFHPVLGHLYPLLPLARAAASQGHSVAFIGAAELAETAPQEVPGAEYLVAGATFTEMASALFARDDFDLANLTPDMEASVFGGLRPQYAAEDSIRVAGDWRPDVIVGEEFDAIAPLLGAVLDRPWYRHGVGPGQVASQRDRILNYAMPFYSAHGVTYRAPLRHLDPCPPTLKTPDWTTDAPVVPLRTEPHAGMLPTPAPDLPDGGPNILVTFGTIFSDPALLTAVTTSLDHGTGNVVVTRGLVLPQLSGEDGTGLPMSVRVVDMVPMATLLSGIDVVLGAGGSGTVLAAAARGIPMVLFPQGADQFQVTQRAVAAGFAVEVGAVDQIPAAVAEVLAGGDYAAAAAGLAREIAAQPDVDSVARQLFAAS